MTETNYGSEQYLLITLSDQNIFINLSFIEMILPLPSFQTIAHHDHSLEGIMNYHGRSVPIYSLARIINIKEEALTIDTPIVLCKLNENLFGLLVTDVWEIVRISHEKIQKIKSINKAKHIQGTVEDIKRSGWVLDLENIFQEKTYSTN